MTDTMITSTEPKQCKCDDSYPESDIDCELHVDCDDRCQALVDPVTLDDYKAALEHWKHHSYLSGCSHGE